MRIHKIPYAFLVILVYIIGVNGFQTHYMFERCNEDLGERIGGRLETSSSLTYENQIDCYTSISVPDGKKILITFHRFDLEEPVSDTCVDYLSVHDGSSTSDPVLIDTLCDSIRDLFNVSTSGRQVTFYFVSDANARFRGFEAVYVAYSDPPCSNDEFRCDSDICIDASYECDDVTQCGDNSDEQNCNNQNNNDDDSALPLDIIIGSTAGGVLLVIIIAFVVYKAYWYWYWKTWMKRNAWKKHLWEDDDQDGYAYPKTDLYQVHDIGKKGRRDPDVAPYVAYSSTYGETVQTEEGGRYLNEM